MVEQKSHSDWPQPVGAAPADAKHAANHTPAVNVKRVLAIALRLLEDTYYLRAVKDNQSLAYPPRLAVDLGSYVDGEAHGWAR